MFADDTSLFIELDDRVEAANKIDCDLTTINHWAKNLVCDIQSAKIRVSDNL